MPTRLNEVTLRSKKLKKENLKWDPNNTHHRLDFEWLDRNPVNRPQRDGEIHGMGGKGQDVLAHRLFVRINFQDWHPGGNSCNYLSHSQDGFHWSDFADRLSRGRHRHAHACRRSIYSAGYYWGRDVDRARIAVPSDFYVGDGWILGPKKRVTRVLDMLCCPIEGGVRRELSSFHNFETKSPNFVFGSWLHLRLYK